MSTFVPAALPTSPATLLPPARLRQAGTVAAIMAAKSWLAYRPGPGAGSRASLRPELPSRHEDLMACIVLLRRVGLWRPASADRWTMFPDRLPAGPAPRD